jgi:hypothetical protein
LEAPQRNELTGADGGPLRIEDDLSDDKLARAVAGIFARARAKREMSGE